MNRELTEGVSQTRERMVLRKEKTEDNDHGPSLFICSFAQIRKYPRSSDFDSFKFMGRKQSSWLAGEN